MEVAVEKVFEGNNLRECIWNVFLEELELPDEAIISLVDQPLKNFDHLNYLEMLLDKYKLTVSNFPNGFNLVIQM